MRMRSNVARKLPVEAKTMRFVDRRYDDQETLHGPAICSRCHAYLETDHWSYDEARYRVLQTHPDVHATVCPGCLRVARRLYEGEVRISLTGDAAQKADIMRLILHEEARVRASNPSARIAVLEEREDEVFLLTTTQFLARRIGRTIQKLIHGTLKVDNLPYERFTRVRLTQ